MEHVLDLQALEPADLREHDSAPSVDSTLSILLCE
jgi:hypothetical protein